MCYTEKYWQKPEMVNSRRQMISEERYEEFEGCLRCIDEKCLREKRGFTMDWRVVPTRKCEKHPKWFVAKALLTPTHKVA